MKTKEKSVYLKRARQQKAFRYKYFVEYLPINQFASFTGLKQFG